MRTAARFLLPALLTGALLLCGCTGKPPEISRVAYQLLLTQPPESSAVTEKLSVFLVADDPDGFEDLATLYVIHDGAELYWKIGSADWTKTTFEAETWIGSNGIATADGSPMPRGEYRVLLQDNNGDTVENVFSLEEPATGAGFPKATLADGVVSCSGLMESPELWIYDLGDRFVTAFAADQGPLAMAPIVQQNPGLKQGYRLRLYTWDRENGVGLVKGPYESGSLKAP